LMSPPISVAFAAALLLLPATGARAGRGKITDEDRKWWSYQPVPAVVPVPHPASKDERLQRWGRNEIDAFILDALLAAKLEPAPEASREVLVRRLYLDVWGLPPTAEQVRAFVNDTAPDAWERLVDQLLASPHYGERWARHWLDLVRYADSDGYKADDYRPEAWRYRDYVIRAFNTDKPFDRFVLEQLAGDELFPDNPEALIATGYLRCGIYEYNNRDVAGQWTAILNDITNTTADVFLGMGLQCARCHDHKFDPLLQKDYFRFQAFFAPLHWPEQATAATSGERAEWQKKQSAWEDATADVRRQIEAIEQPVREKARRDAEEKFPPETRAILAKPAAERTPADQPYFDLAWRQVTYEWNRLDTRIKGTEKEKLTALRKQLAQFDGLKPAPLTPAQIARDFSATAPPVLIPKREKEGAVEAGFPTILSPAPAAVQPLPGSSGRRSALAQWIASPANPLTARVVVNRLWQQHFGRGLTGTSSDFGTLGEKPSHPALLDWLARRLMSGGWHFKDLHRLILTSAVWRQASSSTVGEHARLTDPENRLLWRWNTRRMDSEQIRDAIFSATGELDLTESGPGVDATKPRRAIYVKVLRNVRDPLADAFDAPQNFNSTPTRDTTTTATQSLLLANSRFLMDRAEAMAKRLIAKHADDRALVEAAWQAATNHAPATDEMDEALAFLKAQQQSAAPAGGEFIVDSMPQRDGKAAVLSPGTAQERLVVANDRLTLPDGDFSIESVVLLHSVFADARVRTIASQWDGNRSRPGWLLGVTGQKSRRKPQMPVLQLIGPDKDGRVIEEPVFSDITLQLDRSYYIAAAVHAAPDGKGTVTFFVKDLANDDEPVLTTTVPHPVVEMQKPAFPLVIGDSEGGSHSLWDGLVDEVRIRRGCLTEQTLSLRTPAVTPDTVGCWQFEPSTGFRRDSVSGTETIRPSRAAESSAREAAVTDLCHSLLSSSGLLYVE
ncbi:MAG TPA: DUF1549 domain-containing protein, partial [Verrucomicrobiales bacterium]|nr:DUF1549 domain-containing protein [Verrucomicrobiales bacterium]